VGRANLHLSVLACTTVLVVVAAVLLNTLVDPLSLVNTPTFRGWSESKTMAGRDGGRRFKAAQLARVEPDILILGTSRVEVGIPSNHPGYEGRAVYNAGLSGTNMVEIERVFEYALSVRQPREVLLGLDFLAFGGRRDLVGDFPDSAFAMPQSRVIAKYLFSSNTFLQSLRTIYDNRRNLPPVYDRNGGDPHFERLSAPDYRRMFISVLRDQFLIDPQTYGGFRFSEDRLQALRRIARNCAERGITLRLFITPVHARQLEALRAIGLFGEFERWKRYLADSLSEISRKYPRARLSLWDFSGYSEFTTETVPTAEQSSSPVRWHWESSHFKAALGTLVLDRLFALPVAESLPKDFGVDIRPERVESWLMDTRWARTAYAQSHREEVSDVERLAACTSKIWSALCTDCTRDPGVLSKIFVPCAE